MHSARILVRGLDGALTSWLLNAIQFDVRLEDAPGAKGRGLRHTCVFNADTCPTAYLSDFPVINAGGGVLNAYSLRSLEPAPWLLRTAGESEALTWQ